MKQFIMDVLEDISDSQNGQLNLGSSTARATTAGLISATLKSKGTYTEYTKDELSEQLDREMWVCKICGKSSYESDYDYIGTGTNHLNCELQLNDDDRMHLGIGEYAEDIDEQAYAQGRGSSKDVRREKNSSQKKHEDKVFGHDQGGNYEIPEGLKRAKELSQEALKEGIQKQAYLEMTSDGLPEGGDARAVLESHKLADEIVDRQEGKWIYESPDGGKTVFRRPFADYDPKNKEEIDWETKEPTGRKFTEYPFKEKR